jgi:tryptophan halogenase
MAAGWCWNIPQADARHLGYVYSSAFSDTDAARAELEHRYPGIDIAREIKFQSGRRQHFIKANVAAMGNAYGFVEPLESTALHMLIRHIGWLLRWLETPASPTLANLLNQKVADYWDYLCWFLAIHYKFNRYSDSPFWQHCRAETDVSRHGELIELFKETGPLTYNPYLAEIFDYPDPLWGPEGVDVILLGQALEGHLPQPAVSKKAWLRWQQRAQQWIERLPDQAQLFKLFQEDPSQLAAFEQVLRNVGPAFGA